MRGRLVVGAALVIIGVVWFGQGIGAIGGSFMTGQAVWAVIGVIALLFGFVLIRSARRGRTPGDQ